MDGCSLITRTILSNGALYRGNIGQTIEALADFKIEMITPLVDLHLR